MSVRSEDRRMNEADIKYLIEMTYKQGKKDGWLEKDAPTNRELDEKVNNIYNNWLMMKQEEGEQ